MPSIQDLRPVEGSITASPFHSLLQARESAGFCVKLTRVLPRILDSHSASWYTGTGGLPQEVVSALMGPVGAFQIQSGIEKEEER